MLLRASAQNDEVDGGTVAQNFRRVQQQVNVIGKTHRSRVNADESIRRHLRQGLEISTRAAGMEQLDVAGVGDDADPCRVDPFFDEFVTNAVGDREQPLRLAIQERLQPISGADQEFVLDQVPGHHAVRPQIAQFQNKRDPPQTAQQVTGNADGQRRGGSDYNFRRAGKESGQQAHRE